MRTADVIASDLQDQAYWLLNQEHQYAKTPHPVTMEAMKRSLTEIEKTVKEMWQAVKDMEKVEAQA